MIAILIMKTTRGCIHTAVKYITLSASLPFFPLSFFTDFKHSDIPHV